MAPPTIIDDVLAALRREAAAAHALGNHARASTIDERTKELLAALAEFDTAMHARKRLTQYPKARAELWLVAARRLDAAVTGWQAAMSRRSA